MTLESHGNQYIQYNIVDVIDIIRDNCNKI